MKTENQKVWLITGTSKGLGLLLAKQLLAQDQKVVATSRNIDSFQAQITEHTENLLAISLDITDDQAVKKAMKAAVEKFGRLDVVINNAGYSLVGSMEEMTDQEFKATMNVNLFGTANTIRHAMPYMRQQKSGHIINISSVSGYTGNAKAASYNAAKFGVIGLTEGFAKEAEEFGVKATVIAPGQFRTSFMDSLQYVENKIDIYGIAEAEKTWSQLSGQQKGDPKKLATIVIKVGQMQEPPLHLLVGTDAYEPILKKRQAELEEMKKWKSLTTSTDFD